MATNWIVLVVDDLNDYLVAAQASALRTAALAGGQADPFTKIMPDIATRIRAKIQSCPRNAISVTANAIPPELKWAACYLIIEAMQVRLAGLKLTEDQKAQVNEARHALDRVAECKDTVTTPTDPLKPDSAQRSGGVSVVSTGTRTATRETMDGL